MFNFQSAFNLSDFEYKGESICRGLFFEYVNIVISKIICDLSLFVEMVMYKIKETAVRVSKVVHYRQQT